MSDNVSREAVLQCFGVVCAGACFHDSCKTAKRISQHIRSLPSPGPVAMDYEAMWTRISGRLKSVGVGGLARLLVMPIIEDEIKAIVDASLAARPAPTEGEGASGDPTCGTPDPDQDRPSRGIISGLLVEMFYDPDANGNSLLPDKPNEEQMDAIANALAVNGFFGGMSIVDQSVVERDHSKCIDPTAPKPRP